jgi:hypothetical protein
MAREISAEPAQVFGRRQGAADYLYAIAERLPRRWRPPADGVDAAPVVARVIPRPHADRERRRLQMTIRLVSLSPGAPARVSLRAPARTG